MSSPARAPEPETEGDDGPSLTAERVAARDRVTQWLDVEGLRVAFELRGSGPPLLLLNGLTLPAASWGPFMGELTVTSDRTFVAPDGPGVGRSPRPRALVSIPTLARLVTAILDAVGIEDCDVVGYSHGGAVAQQLAVDAPDRVRRLVLAATSCGIGGVPGNVGVLMKGLPWHRTTEGRAMRADPLGALFQAWSYAAWSSVGFLGAIHQPTLVIAGTYDLIVPPVNGRVLARRIPNASFLQLPVDHDLFGTASVTTTTPPIAEFLA